MASASRVRVGTLVSFKDSAGSSNGSVSTIPIFEGINVVGRNHLVVPDKRISRKHLSLKTSADGSIEITVEGPNPIVVRSEGQRRKVCAQEKTKITHDDVLELIPGDYLMKYIDKTDECKSSTPSGSCGVKGKRHSEEDSAAVKRNRQIMEDETLARILQESIAEESTVVFDIASSQTSSLLDSAGSSKRSNGRMHSVGPSNDVPSLTFRLMRVQGLQPWANSSSVTVQDVIQVLLIQLMVMCFLQFSQIIWWTLIGCLLMLHSPACPSLRKVPHVLVIHGEDGASLERLKKMKPANWILHKPPLPISFGTHHSKAMLLVYPQGIRVVVHTANMIHVDWNNKSQGLWMQDFPWKDANDTSKKVPFENDLVDYLGALKVGGYFLFAAVVGDVNINAAFFRRFDYSTSMVRLIGSVPGYHVGPNVKKWGHMKLRSVLEECMFEKQFSQSPLIYQGYAAGSCIPSPQKNVEKDFLRKYWTRWKADHVGRCRAMPHIKTFTRYNGQNIAWFLLTSSNLSKAAWGALQKNNTQLMIRSYELGVLFLPQTLKSIPQFSCTEKNLSSLDSLTLGKTIKTKLVTLCWKGDEEKESSTKIVRLPVPYQLPPQHYGAHDVPWSWDRRYTEKDVYGSVWPRHG
nr:unnamed protein product [Digitaria exilis]